MNESTTCQINLGASNPIKLARALEEALALSPKQLDLHLFHAKRVTHPETVLLLHDILLSRPEHTLLRTVARTKLYEGEVLLWLAGDIRVASDWCHMRVSSMQYLYGEKAKAEESRSPGARAHRLVLDRLSPYFPEEAMDIYLLHEDLRGWGFLPDAEIDRMLDACGAGSIPFHDPGDTPYLNSSSSTQKSQERTKP